MLWIIIAGFLLVICAVIFGTVAGILSTLLGFITRLWFIRKTKVTDATEELTYKPAKPVVKKTYRRAAK